MRIIPSFKLNVLEEENFFEEMSKIEDQLSKIKHSGYFEGVNKNKIYYEYFLCENSKGSIVVVHGLIEFTKKYYEFAFYMLNQGYNVFLYDQRCHGLSDRLTDRIDLIHVDTFGDYAKDLELFINNIVVKASDVPLYIYAHSMGGAVASLYLSNNSIIKKAVLTAPMIEPYMGTIRLLAKLYIGDQVKRYGGDKKCVISGEFNPNPQFRLSNDGSESRFNYNMDIRRNNVNYQTTPMSISWVYNSVIFSTTVLKDKIIKNIKTPILMFSAENDRVVKNSAQNKLAKKLPCCKRVVVKCSKHSILTANAISIENHIKDVLAFLEN